MDKYKKRHNSRIVAAQTLYISMMDPQSLWQESLRTLSTLEQTKDTLFERNFAEDLIISALKDRDTFDRDLNPWMKNGIDSIPLIERAILWIACTELNKKPRLVSKSVILNESLNLIKELSDNTNVKFLNALLDKYASSLAAAEKLSSELTAQHPLKDEQQSLPPLGSENE